MKPNRAWSQQTARTDLIRAAEPHVWFVLGLGPGFTCGTEDGGGSSDGDGDVNEGSDDDDECRQEAIDALLDAIAADEDVVGFFANLDYTPGMLSRPGQDRESQLRRFRATCIAAMQENVPIQCRILPSADGGGGGAGGEDDGESDGESAYESAFKDLVKVLAEMRSKTKTPPSQSDEGSGGAAADSDSDGGVDGAGVVSAEAAVSAARQFAICFRIFRRVPKFNCGTTSFQSASVMSLATSPVIAQSLRASVIAAANVVPRLDCSQPMNCSVVSRLSRRTACRVAGALPCSGMPAVSRIAFAASIATIRATLSTTSFLYVPSHNLTTSSAFSSSSALPGIALNRLASSAWSSLISSTHCWTCAEDQALTFFRVSVWSFCAASGDQSKAARSVVFPDPPSPINISRSRASCRDPAAAACMNAKTAAAPPLLATDAGGKTSEGQPYNLKSVSESVSLDKDDGNRVRLEQ